MIMILLIVIIIVVIVVIIIAKMMMITMRMMIVMMTMMIHLLCLMRWLRRQDPLTHGCHILGCEVQIFCRPPELGLRDTQVGRVAGNVLVFGPLLHRGIWLRSLRKSFSDG